jgi:hypothetical protein
MSDHDDDRPKKVVPLGNEVQSALARLLRESYARSLSEEIPDNILALYRRFDELTKEESALESPSPPVSPAAKEPPPE